MRSLALFLKRHAAQRLRRHRLHRRRPQTKSLPVYDTRSKTSPTISLPRTHHPGPEAEGFIKGIKWRGNVNASQVVELQFSQNVTQVFFGVNLKCASCHDSFIDNWKHDDAYAIAAVIATSRSTSTAATRRPASSRRRASFGRSWARLTPRRRKQNGSSNSRPRHAPGKWPLHAHNRQSHLAAHDGRGIVHPVDMMGKPNRVGRFARLSRRLSGRSEIRPEEADGHIATSKAYQARPALQTKNRSARIRLPRPGTAAHVGEQFSTPVWMLTRTALPKQTRASARSRSRFGCRRKRRLIRASLKKSDALMRSLGRPIASKSSRRAPIN